MHNSSRRDKGQLKAEKLKTVFIQHTVNKITLSLLLSSATLMPSFHPTQRTQRKARACLNGHCFYRCVLAVASLTSNASAALDGNYADVDLGVAAMRVVIGSPLRRHVRRKCRHRRVCRRRGGRASHLDPIDPVGSPTRCFASGERLKGMSDER